MPRFLDTDICIAFLRGTSEAVRDRLLRLSRGVREARSLTALGIAAHEAGHAIQQAAGYPGLVARNLVVPWTGLGSQVCWVLMVAGLWLGMERLIVLAIMLFSLSLVLQLLNLSLIHI